MFAACDSASAHSRGLVRHEERRADRRLIAPLVWNRHAQTQHSHTLAPALAHRRDSRSSLPMSSSASSAKTATAASAGGSAPAAAATPVQVSTKTGKKICCSCPETRKARDECVLKFEEKNCLDLIEAHKVCLRSEGFKV